METPEFNRRPEIADQKLKELLSILDSIKFKDFEEFDFDGVKFLLQILPPSHLKKEEGGAWFSSSTYIEGIDIYIVKKQSPETRKRQMFHEVVEARAQGMGFDQDTAHQYALEQEQKIFAQDIKE
jgi:hypothetical protein